MVKTRMKRRDIGKLVGTIAACEGAGGIGAIFTTPAIPTWYEALAKPAFTPPNAVFSPVWVTLYLLMGIAIFLVWRKGLKTEGVKPAFIIFWVQLVINILWSAVFFGLKTPLGGFIVIILLLIAVVITIVQFFKVSRLAGGLLIPYIVWLGIATSLNVGIWMLNP